VAASYESTISRGQIQLSPRSGGRSRWEKKGDATIHWREDKYRRWEAHSARRLLSYRSRLYPVAGGVTVVTRLPPTLDAHCDNPFPRNLYCTWQEEVQFIISGHFFLSFCFILKQYRERHCTKVKRDRKPAHQYMFVARFTFDARYKSRQGKELLGSGGTGDDVATRLGRCCFAPLTKVLPIPWPTQILKPVKCSKQSPKLINNENGGAV
jgi:hypothetical protein